MEIEKKGKRKVLEGIVVSDAMEKTVIVLVGGTVKDQRYKKYVHKRKKLMAHDEKNECRVGDKVEIVETRPLSKQKRFRVRRVLEKGKIMEEVSVNDTE